MKQIVLWSALFTLTACSSLTSSFDCPRSAAVSCQSLDQINHRIDIGELPLLAMQKKVEHLC